ncbi:phosphotransferase family protein [Actinoplanes sp. NPDC051475]|uniref:phosphotransferase family protein n=1 Tax=Actinoplanes sp. NPDC051475 TaxID=3157225 RepID=UPI0034500873
MSAREVRQEDAFDAGAMAAWLAGNAAAGSGIDLTTVPEVRQFSGGVSNLTYLLRYPGGDLILRRPPKGEHRKGAHDMAREHRIQTQLARHLPYVPRTVALCEDTSVIGTPFYVMQRLTGPIPRKELPRGVQLDREQTAALCRNVIDLLVDLHSVDVAATGLGDLGKGEGYVARQVAGWSERYRRARTRSAGSFETEMDWLDRHQPRERPHTLVHNDFRFDNVVLDPADPTRPVGLLDWELATVGDPLLDLANSLGYWVQRGDGPLMQLFRRQPTHLPGMMTREQVVAYYCARTGATVTHAEWAWYQVFGLFRVAVIAQQVYQRYVTGQTTNKKFRHFGSAVLILELRCRRIIRRARKMSPRTAATPIRPSRQGRRSTTEEPSV